MTVTEAGRGGDEASVDPAMLRLLADGRMAEVPGRLDGLRATDPLLAEVVAADAGARGATVGLAELRDLHERVARRAPDRPLLRWWMVAVLGERAFLDTDLGAVPLAIAALDEVPDEPFAGAALLHVRGRLRRIASALYLLDPSPENVAGHRRLRDAALADLMRCDLTAEVAITQGLSAALTALATWDDVLEGLEVLRDARALLGDIEGSAWVPLLDHLTGLVALTAGDLVTADTAIAAVESRRLAHPVFAALGDVGRAELGLVASGGSAEAAGAVIAALDRLRRTHPHLLALEQMHAANILADLGRADAARRVGLPALGWPPANAVIAAAGELLRFRLDVLDGDRRPVAEAEALLAETERLGHARRAGATALRLARDLGGAGDAAGAGALRAWGLDRMPTPRRRTAWEHWWAGDAPHPPGGGPRPGPAVAGPVVPAAVVVTATLGVITPPGPAPAPIAPPAPVAVRVAVRVLAPAVELTIGGAPVRLREMPAKLLLGLVAALPEPLHVERAVDLLWPDAAAGVGRDRLNTVTHRLRSALAGAGDGRRALRRVGEMLVLDTDGWDVDLLRLRRALRGGGSDDSTGGGDDLREALLAARGNLAHVQFPYDDLLVDHRRALAADVARAVAAGHAGHAGHAGRTGSPDGRLDDAVRALLDAG